MASNNLKQNLFNENTLNKTEEDYSYFEHIPVAIFVEDFSEVKRYVEAKASEKNLDVKKFLLYFPEVIHKINELQIIKDVNNAAVKLYKAKSKEDLLGNLEKMFTKNSHSGFMKLVRDILLGKKNSKITTVNKTFDGNEIDILINFKVKDGFEKTLENVIVTVENITERVRDREKLIESENRYKEAQKIAKIGSWSYTYATKELFWSSEAYQLLGIQKSKRKLDLEFYLSFVHEDDKKLVDNFEIDYLLKNPHHNITYRLKHKKGNLIYINETRNVIIEGNRITKIVGIFQDITENFLAEKDLNKTKNLLSRTLSNIQDGFVLLDKNSNYLFVNKKAEELLGKSSSELIGKNIWAEFPEKEGDVFYDSYQKAVTTNKSVNFENYFKPWNKWFENRIIPSNEGTTIFFEEITDKKQTENKIKEAYNIINKSPSVAFLSENKQNFPVVFASENTKKLFGYSYKEFLEGNIKLLNVVHPKDLNYLKSEAYKLIDRTNKEVSPTLKTKPFRIITKTGNTKWIKANIDALYNSSNEITHLQGIVEDVSEQKLTQDLLFESNHRLKETFNHTPLASIMWDLDYNVIEWNTSAVRIFGYTEEEAKSLPIKHLLTPPELASEMKKIRGNILNFKANKNTNENITKNGKRITCRWYNVQLKDAEGNVIGVASLVEDISEQKITQDLLFESNQRLKETFDHTPLASIMWDLDMKVLDWNKSAENTFGYPKKEAVGKTAFELIVPKEIIGEISEVKKTLLDQKGGFKNTNINRTKKGEIINCEWYNVTIKDVNGKITGMASLVEDITERINVKNQIEKSEKKYRSIFENSIDPVFVLKNGVFIDSNEAAVKLFGFTKKSDFIKIHPSQISPEKQPNGQLSFDKANEMINIAVEKGYNRFKWYHKSIKGKVFPTEVTLTKIEEGPDSILIHAVVKDITDIVKQDTLEDVLYNISKAALTINDFKQFSLYIKKQLQLVINTNNFYIALHNKETDIITTPVFVDEKEQLEDFPAENSLTGYVIKSKKPLLLTNEEHQQLIKKGEVSLIGSSAECWLGVPLIIKEDVIGAIVVQSYTNKKEYNLSDVHLLEFVADQISTTIQRKKKDNELKQALLKAQESDKLKSSFLANMSHEIRTPMNGIIGFSEFLLEPNLNEDVQKKYANVIINSSKRLLAIVNDILDISKIEAGMVKLNYENVNLNTLLDDLYNFYKPVADAQKLNLIYHKGVDNLKSVIETDKTKLNQILTNLISNAFKFTNQGNIEFGCNLNNEMIEFYVKDSGIGIKEELIDKIFDRFTQAEMPKNKQIKGTGLGLAISKKFVELFKGKIWLESSKKGTTVYFNIPYSKKAIEVSTVIEKDKKMVPKHNKNITILVAEDEEYNRMYIEELFSKTKHTIIEAFDGVMAIELFKKHKNIDVVLMDIKMPKMDGVEAMKKIKQLKPIPIIALSAFAMESDKKEAIKQGFDNYLTKPVNKNKLFEIINEYAN